MALLSRPAVGAGVQHGVAGRVPGGWVPGGAEAGTGWVVGGGYPGRQGGYLPGCTWPGLPVPVPSLACLA